MASGLDSYRNVGAYGNLAEASPYQVIQLMLDALLSRIARQPATSSAARSRRRARRSARRSASSKGCCSAWTRSAAGTSR